MRTASVCVFFAFFFFLSDSPARSYQHVKITSPEVCLGTKSHSLQVAAATALQSALIVCLRGHFSLENVPLFSQVIFHHIHFIPMSKIQRGETVENPVFFSAFIGFIRSAASFLSSCRDSEFNATIPGEICPSAEL